MVAHPKHKAFAKPVSISDDKLAFPIAVFGLMPPWREIPPEFKKGDNPYRKFQEHWVLHGMDGLALPVTKVGIEPQVALQHLTAIQQSSAPKPAYKQAAVAYLMSLWYEPPVVMPTVAEVFGDEVSQPSPFENP